MHDHDLLAADTGFRLEPPAAVVDQLAWGARRFGTPLYATDLRALDAASHEVQAAFPDPWIRQYSLKANDLPAIVGHLHDRGWGANVVSLGEWSLARRAGVPNGDITLEGIGKTNEDLRAVMRAQRGGEPLRWVSLESADEVRALARLCGRRDDASQRPVEVLLRFNPAVDPETSGSFAVGRSTSKFGMSRSELIGAIDAVGADRSPFTWRGVHLHVGSQLAATDAWAAAIERALDVVAWYRSVLPSFDTIDVGGGFPIPYDGTPMPRPADFVAAAAKVIADSAHAGTLRLAMEPGRFLVGGAGWLLGRVLHVRARTAMRVRQVVLDVGMAELVRPAMYGARHPIIALTSLGRRAETNSAHDATEVHGPICESTDVLGLHQLPPLRRGDFVAIGLAGAYGASLSSRYNGRRRAAEVFLDEGGAVRLVRRRGTLTSLG